jgi:large subunit ribosomal protein L25
MSAVRELKAVSRERSGKGGARAERRQGRVPAVIYGGGADAVSIALDGNEMRQLIFAGHFLTTIFELDVGGDRTRVIPRDYQLDPVKDTPSTSISCASPQARPSRSKCRCISSGRMTARV